MCVFKDEKMISMTGYTKKDFKINKTRFSLILKSLNSNKGLDINIKTPRYLVQLEPEVKKMFQKQLIRGKIDLKIFEIGERGNLNLDDIKLSQYLKRFKKIVPKVDDGDLLKAAISLPDIFTSSTFRFTKKVEKQFLNIITLSILDLIKYRKKEGKRMIQVIKGYITSILKITRTLIPLEKARQIRKKQQLVEKITSLIKDIEYDPLRLETEMIYYIEKYDITEERIRLQYHCKFFLEIIRTEEFSGRKLLFLSQEILREINTIGSKANDFEIQRQVVQMKENIDKTKEQLQNIL